MAAAPHALWEPGCCASSAYPCVHTCIPFLSLLDLSHRVTPNLRDSRTCSHWLGGHVPTKTQVGFLSLKGGRDLGSLQSLPQFTPPHWPTLIPARLPTASHSHSLSSDSPSLPNAISNTQWKSWVIKVTPEMHPPSKGTSSRPTTVSGPQLQWISVEFADMP